MTEKVGDRLVKAITFAKYMMFTNKHKKYISDNESDDNLGDNMTQRGSASKKSKNSKWQPVVAVSSFTTRKISSTKESSDGIYMNS